MVTGDTCNDEPEELGVPGDVGIVVQSDIQPVMKKFNIGADETSVHLILGGWRAVVAPRLKKMVVTDLHYLVQPGYTQVITGLRQGLLPDYILGVLANNEVGLADSNAHTRELNQLRAENRTYASAVGGDQMPRGARWESRKGQDNRGTPMDGAGEEKGTC